MSAPRRARVRALAKINLGLKVLHKRPDDYHELRTVFQTVSLADTLDIAFTPGRRTQLTVSSSVEIADNLAGRAAKCALDRMRATGTVEIRVDKRIPIGAGLGGGSSDAAAVLLALPVLARKPVPLPELIDAASELGSDVPFFLLGGAAVAVGRGTELYPLPDPPRAWALLVVPDVSVSTAAAYRALARPVAELTSPACPNIIKGFQSWVWEPAAGSTGNDFESVVFLEHPQLKSMKRRLEQAGGSPAMLSGSGSAVYGLFSSREKAERARLRFPRERAMVVSLVSRSRYRALWRRNLNTMVGRKVWPPQN